MHKPEPVRENETHLILWNFENLNGSPNHSPFTKSRVNWKRIYNQLDFVVLVGHRVLKKQNKRKQKERQMFTSCERTKTVDDEDDGDTVIYHDEGRYFHGVWMTTIHLYKNITLPLYLRKKLKFLGYGKRTDGERQRQTAILTHNFFFSWLRRPS